MAAQMKARPTTYKGIKMRSRMEAGFAQWADESFDGWRYEPECFASELGQYLPDFFIPSVEVISFTSRHRPLADLYVETKPSIYDDLNEFAVNAAIVHANKPDVLVALARENVFGLIVSVAPFDLRQCVWVQGEIMPYAIAELTDPEGTPWHGAWWKGVK